jgi:D-glycero-D-manno-heptose 1,7-bisphosphate phosphatase
MRPAVFIDRDGTLVDDPPPGYIAEAEKVSIFPGSAEALARVGGLGYLIVMVTNQAGIGRGLISWTQYHAVAARVEAILGENGVRLDGTYLCPHAPERDGECPCRKPKLALYERAGAELGIDYRRSWWVGDRITDLLPARALGGAGILVLTGHGPDFEEAARREGFAVVSDLAAAVSAIAVPR